MPWWTEVADLVLARTCVACGQPGPPLCEPCHRQARRSGLRRTDAHPPIAVGTGYRGVGRTVVLAHKRHLVRALAPALGSFVADAVERVQPAPLPVTLVPIPPHRHAIRVRGQDTVRAITQAAADALQSRGWSACMQPILVRTEARASLAGATKAQRRALVEGAFRVRTPPQTPVIVVDDVVASGATLRSALLTLQAAGCTVLGGAAAAG
jgi:predicted amidophosphoribosyltransferase